MFRLTDRRIDFSKHGLVDFLQTRRSLYEKLRQTGFRQASFALGSIIIFSCACQAAANLGLVKMKYKTPSHFDISTFQKVLKKFQW